MRNKYPIPVFYVLLPKTGQWTGHYNPVVEDKYLGTGRDAVFDLSMYTHPEGANNAIRICQDSLQKRKRHYIEKLKEETTNGFQRTEF